MHTEELSTAVWRPARIYTADLTYVVEQQGISMQVIMTYVCFISFYIFLVTSAS